MKFLNIFLVFAYCHSSYGQTFNVNPFSKCLEKDKHSTLNFGSDMKTLIYGAEDFSINLFEDIAVKHPENSITMSPFSVWSVMNLAYYGAGGSTASQLRKALGGLGKYPAQFSSNIMRRRLRSNKGSTFSSANMAFFDTSMTVSKCAKAVITDLHKVDFSNANEAAKIINKKISEATKGKIGRFLTPQVIQLSKFILLNAVYFKGTWQTKFPEIDTTDSLFYDQTGQREIASAPMMKLRATLPSISSPRTENKLGNLVFHPVLDAKIVELPYDNSDISMVVILPHEITNVNKILAEIKKIKPSGFNYVLSQLKEQTADVFLPKFNMTTRIAKELKEGLQKLGITDLFDASRLNLSNYLPNDDVNVAETLHHATIQVNEEGTVAAAVTAVLGTRSGGSPHNFVLNANRPFIFLVRDMKQNLTLFIGVYRDPTQVN